jgi:hypothetical protein
MKARSPFATLLPFPLLAAGLLCTTPALLAEQKQGAPPSPHPGMSAEELHNIQFRCAGNSLYLLAGMRGVKVAFTEIEQKLPVTERGVSMLALRDAARELGMPSEVRRLRSVEELNDCTLPVIAYFRSSFDGNPTGHFVVIVELVQNGPRRGIWFIETTNGNRMRFRWERFDVYWNGYVLQPAGTAPATDKMLLIWTTALWPVIGLIWWTKRRVPAAGACAKAAVFAACVALAGATAPAQAAEDGATDELTYRRPEADGVNGLYLLCKCLGRPVSYSQVRAAVNSQGGRVNLVTLRDAGNRLGIPLVLRKCTPAELAELKMPIIVHMADLRRGGQFVLLCGVNPTGRYPVIETGTVEVRNIDADEFRRLWSGHVLQPVDTWRDWRVSYRGWELSLTFGILASVVLAPVGYRWLKPRPR